MQPDNRFLANKYREKEGKVEDCAREVKKEKQNKNKTRISNHKNI